MMNNKRGFTLLELIVVIIILGIVATSILPKLLDLSSDARVATLQGLKGSIASASTAVYAKAAMERTESLVDEPLIINGEEIYTNYGYPNVGGSSDNAFSTSDIVVWLNVNVSYSDTADSDWYLDIKSIYTIVFYPQDYVVSDKDGDGDATECNVTYIDAASEGELPSITVYSDDC